MFVLVPADSTDSTASSTSSRLSTSSQNVDVSAAPVATTATAAADSAVPSHTTSSTDADADDIAAAVAVAVAPDAVVSIASSPPANKTAKWNFGECDSLSFPPLPPIERQQPTRKRAKVILHALDVPGFSDAMQHVSHSFPFLHSVSVCSLPLDRLCDFYE